MDNIGDTMKKKDNKLQIITTCGFIFGLVLYLSGLFLIFGTTLSKLDFAREFFYKLPLTNNIVDNMKLYGCIMFFIGFTIFIISVVLLYKNNKITESNKELIIEGQADVITLLVMSYVLIFMLVVCLMFDQVIGALLFGIALLIQNLLNAILIKYFSHNKRRV